MANREELEQKTKEELLELARERDLEGRSGMNKEELVDTLSSSDSSSDAEGDGSVSEGGDEVRDAEDLLTPTGESEDGESEGVEERQNAASQYYPESAPKEGSLAYAMDAAGPLHIQSPEERIMTGAVSEEQAKEQEKLLANKPDDYVGDVTEAGFDEDGNVRVAGRRATAPVVEVVDEDVADTVGKESRGERRERQGLESDTPDEEKRNQPRSEPGKDSSKDEA